MFDIRSPAWRSHCQSARPSANLGRLIHDCSDDAVTRSLTITATVLALAQLSGLQMMLKPPGFVLVNAGGAAADPIDAVTGKLTGPQGVRMQRDEESFERNRQSMLSEIAGGGVNPGLAAQRAASFRQYRQDAYGYGRVGSYTRQLDPQLGWMTDASRHLPLRLEDDLDRAAFRADVRCKAERLLNPEGYGESITLERKVLSVAGSLRAEDWDEEFVSGVINLALPVLFLPHTQEVPLKVPGIEELELMATCLEQETHLAAHQPVEVMETMLLDDWSSPCIERLRRRLSKFPPDYEFFIQTTIRQLCEWCYRIAWMATMDGTGRQERLHLWHDLQAMSLHGICLGVDALGWHGYGFDAGCKRQQAVEILQVIREDRTITRRDLLRKLQWLKAEQRDTVLERLAHEGLVTLSDRQVSAVAAADYLRTIPVRSGTSAPPMISTAPAAGKPSKSLAEGYMAIRAAAAQARAQAMMPLENDPEFAMTDDGVDYSL